MIQDSPLIYGNEELLMAGFNANQIVKICNAASVRCLNPVALGEAIKDTMGILALSAPDDAFLEVCIEVADAQALRKPQGGRKIARMSTELFIEILTDGRSIGGDGLIIRCVKGLPPGAKLVSIYPSYQFPNVVDPEWINLVFEHPDCPQFDVRQRTGELIVEIEGLL